MLPSPAAVSDARQLRLRDEPGVEIIPTTACGVPMIVYRDRSA